MPYRNQGTPEMASAVDNEWPSYSRSAVRSLRQPTLGQPGNPLSGISAYETEGAG